MKDEKRYRVRDKRRNAFMNIDVFDNTTIYWHKKIGSVMKYEEAEKIVEKNSHYEMVEL